MGQYDKYDRLIIPANIAKTVATSSIPTIGRRKAYGGPGNEGIDLAVWFQEKIDNGIITITNPDITSLITLTGLPSGSTNLGSFTGSIISDNTTIFDAFQELETYIETITPDGNGIYDGNGNIPDNTIASALNNFSINTPTAGAVIQIGDYAGASDPTFGGYHLEIRPDSSAKLISLNHNNGFITNSFYTQMFSGSFDFLRLSGDANSELRSAYTSFKIGAQNIGTFEGLVYASDISANFVPLSLVTKGYVDSLLTPSITVGSGLIGDGSPGDPLDWAGGFSASPITGSGTSFFPFTVANNSITTSHIADGTILFSDWSQNSATSGQVPQWNGSAWIATSVSGTLPSGSTGDILVFDGTNYSSVSPINETQTGITGTTVTLAASPESYAQFMLFKNGLLQVVTDDFTRSGVTITMNDALIATDKITAIYYII